MLGAETDTLKEKIKDFANFNDGRLWISDSVDQTFVTLIDSEMKGGSSLKLVGAKDPDKPRRKVSKKNVGLNKKITSRAFTKIIFIK